MSLDKDFLRAIRQGDLSTVIHLSEIIDPSFENSYALAFASKYNLEIVEFLLKDPRIDPSANYNLAITNACKDGNLAIVNRLLEDPRVDPSDNQNFCLINASASGQIKIVNRLLEDPRVNPYGEPICVASVYGNFKIVERLMKDPRVDPSYGNNKAAIEALRWDYINVFKLLFQDQRVRSQFLFNPIYMKIRNESKRRAEKIFSKIVEEYERDILDRCNTIKEQLMMKAWHPNRVEKWINAGIDVEDM